jgi:uncharacterized protein YdaT
MHWSHLNYPEPMRKLHADVRSRAIDIANKLIEEGMEAEVAITTAIQRAEAWTDHRNEPSEINEGHRSYHQRNENG